MWDGPLIELRSPEEARLLGEAVSSEQTGDRVRIELVGSAHGVVEDRTVLVRVVDGEEGEEETT